MPRNSSWGVSGVNIRKVAVVGAGIMGHGIAQLCAQKGFSVGLMDASQAFLDRGMKTIRKSLDRMVQAGRVDAAEVEAVLARIQASTELAFTMDGADMVIEAVTEDLAVKKELFARLDQVCPGETIYATNTSQLSITTLAASSCRPERVCGMHFFNPPQLMKLVEIVPGLQTSKETLGTVLELAHFLGKETVVSKDSRGFITSRLSAAWKREAMSILEEGVASAADIDMACRLAFNHPMGPFELTDYSGLDTLLYALEGLQQVYGERFRPPQLLHQMVAAGRLGRKTNRGFYEYDRGGADG